jgi:hypothetical protein
MWRVQALGCQACLVEGIEDSPAEIHHPRALGGMGKRASHLDVIGLCAAHHRTGGYGVALHAGQEAFERRFGTELELLAKVREQLGDPE